MHTAYHALLVVLMVLGAAAIYLGSVRRTGVWNGRARVGREPATYRARWFRTRIDVHLSAFAIGLYLVVILLFW